MLLLVVFHGTQLLLNCCRIAVGKRAKVVDELLLLVVFHWTQLLLKCCRIVVGNGHTQMVLLSCC